MFKSTCPSKSRDDYDNDKWDGGYGGTNDKWGDDKWGGGYGSGKGEWNDCDDKYSKYDDCDDKYGRYEDCNDKWDSGCGGKDDYVYN
ncbi:hypothetical protein [Pseudonocardia sp. N23]|uniref:hypothetical protein n=1 Tax=Pseudonocardia sp. N23 TaxID=1987376 RepID=UPI000BFE5312|nr:hypothetical protein [Pseudonocardia sp. N23]GAY08379.1 hypothetical protein TOK_1936 [Pseudonocardia sp. N23]